MYKLYKFTTRNDQYSGGKLTGFNQLHGKHMHSASNYSQVCKMRLAYDTVSRVCFILNLSTIHDFRKFEFSYE